MCSPLLEAAAAMLSGGFPWPRCPLSPCFPVFCFLIKTKAKQPKSLSPGFMGLPAVLGPQHHGGLEARLPDVGETSIQALQPADLSIPRAAGPGRAHLHALRREMRSGIYGFRSVQTAGRCRGVLAVGRAVARLAI